MSILEEIKDFFQRSTKPKLKEAHKRPIENPIGLQRRQNFSNLKTPQQEFMQQQAQPFVSAREEQEFDAKLANLKNKMQQQYNQGKILFEQQSGRKLEQADLYRKNINSFKCLASVYYAKLLNDLSQDKSDIKTRMEKLKTIDNFMKKGNEGFEKLEKRRQFCVEGLGKTKSNFLKRGYENLYLSLMDTTKMHFALGYQKIKKQFERTNEMNKTNINILQPKSHVKALQERRKDQQNVCSR